MLHDHHPVSLRLSVVNQGAHCQAFRIVPPPPEFLVSNRLEPRSRRFPLPRPSGGEVGQR